MLNLFINRALEEVINVKMDRRLYKMSELKHYKFRQKKGPSR